MTKTKIIITAIIIIMLARGIFRLFYRRKPSEMTNDTAITGGFPDTGDSAGRASSEVPGLAEQSRICR